MNETGRTPIVSATAPAPIGPYSQAIKCSGFVFVSGQLGLGADGNLVAADAPTQARKVLEHVSSILDAAGSGLGRVVKTTIFLTNLADFAEVNKVYAEFFPFEPPARSTIQVAALPKGACVEIEVIAQANPAAFAGAATSGSTLS